MVDFLSSKAKTDILTRGIAGIGRITGSVTTTVTTRGTIRIVRIVMLRICVTRVSFYRTVKLQQRASATAFRWFLGRAETSVSLCQLMDDRLSPAMLASVDAHKKAGFKNGSPLSTAIPFVFVLDRLEACPTSIPSQLRVQVESISRFGDSHGFCRANRGYRPSG